MLEAPVAPSVRLGRALPADLEAVVLACLAKNRDDRPASATALRLALLACADASRNDLEAARAWWQAHHALQKKDVPSAVDGVGDATSRPATMAIELGGRIPDDSDLTT